MSQPSRIFTSALGTPRDPQLDRDTLPPPKAFPMPHLSPGSHLTSRFPSCLACQSLNWILHLCNGYLGTRVTIVDWMCEPGDEYASQYLRWTLMTILPRPLCQETTTEDWRVLIQHWLPDVAMVAMRTLRYPGPQPGRAPFTAVLSASPQPHSFHLHNRLRGMSNLLSGPQSHE